MRALHGGSGDAGPLAPLEGLKASAGYRPYLPSPLWGEVRPDTTVAATLRADAEPGEPAGEEEEQERERRRARRRKFDAAQGPDPLALINKGEMLLLRTEAIDISRPDDDEDDPEAAKKAARDMDELSLGRPDSRRTASRVRMGLDLPAEAWPRARRSRPG